jgi:hypothetical protein
LNPRLRRSIQYGQGVAEESADSDHSGEDAHNGPKVTGD